MQFESVKVGDVVLYHDNYTHTGRLIKVARITPTRIVLDDARAFRKSDGRLIGKRIRWNFNYIKIPTDNEIKEIREHDRRQLLTHYIREVKWRELDLELLEQVAKLLGIK